MKQVELFRRIGKDIAVAQEAFRYLEKNGRCTGSQLNAHTKSGCPNSTWRQAFRYANLPVNTVYEKSRPHYEIKGLAPLGTGMSSDEEVSRILCNADRARLVSAIADGLRRFSDINPNLMPLMAARFVESACGPADMINDRLRRSTASVREAMRDLRRELDVCEADFDSLPTAKEIMVDAK